MKVSELLGGVGVLRSVVQSSFQARLHRFQVRGPWANCLSTQGLCLERGTGIPGFSSGCEEAMGHSPKELRSWPMGSAIVIVINVHTSQQQQRVPSRAPYQGHQLIEFTLAFSPAKIPWAPILEVQKTELLSG